MASAAPAAAGDFVFQWGKVCDRSVPFQGQVLSCGVGPAVWRDGGEMAKYWLGERRLKGWAEVSLSKVGHPYICHYGQQNKTYILHMNTHCSLTHTQLLHFKKYLMRNHPRLFFFFFFTTISISFNNKRMKCQDESLYEDVQSMLPPLVKSIKENDLEVHKKNWLLIWSRSTSGCLLDIKQLALRQCFQYFLGQR